MRFIGKFIQIIFGSFFALLTLGAIGLFAVYSYYTPQLPSDADLRKIEVQVPLRIYSRENQLIAEYGEKHSRPVKLSEVPEKLQLAFLDIEDARFYDHGGVDFKGVARALYSAASTGETSQGASTITMQLARNSFLNAERTFDRKLKETLLAFRIEQELNKKEILELYLNKIYLGKSAYGVASAAETYYGKPLGQLTLAQYAMIAGLPKAPSRYNPIVNPDRAMQRRNYILQRMLEFKHISQSEYDTATHEPNTATVHEIAIETNAPYLAEMVRAEIVKRYGITNAYTQGYNVYTTLDSKQQASAEESLRSALMSYDHRHGYRGAEEKLDLGDFKNEEELRDKLSTYPTLGGLEPALVLQASASSAELMVGETKINLKTSDVAWARPFKSADQRGASPRRVNDVLHVGDIVRVRQTDKEKNTWTLSQVPTVGGALVALDPSDGAIRAVVGGFDFYHSKFNRVTQASRQPGSSFKPVIYSAALAKGFTPSSVVNDAPITIPGSNWHPENFGGHYVGPTTIAEALAKSRNLVSIRLLRSIGINYAVDFATRFGFPREDLPANLTLALGTGMTTPLGMATAYSAFANGGYKIEPYFITKIQDGSGKLMDEIKPIKICGDNVETCTITPPEDKSASKEADTNKDKNKKDAKAGESKAKDEEKTKDAGKPIWETAALGAGNTTPVQPGAVQYPAAKRILDKRTHYQIVSMLQGVTQFGTAARAGRALNRKDIAGKTGTTNDQKDAWFCGFTPNLVAVSWMGFDDMAKLGEGETATNVALPMWIDYMHRVLAGTPSKEWERPVDLKEADLTPPDLIDGVDGEGNPATDENRPAAGFQYQSEGDIAAQRQAAQPQQPNSPNQPARPAAPRRPPERVEIPEQLF
ncbi:MAG: penicillin-binding protein 1A [Thiothrix sp.]|uniref:penicillin-binding protein 1A n=1 Tax=Thiothrix sp. TaxID=1032 RepID=UPI00260A41E7|nr:penicillin-binding protein 1A [Thiothrix sp.]MDD5392140.1 penicillin-binding protein 1A [Thiothrix sp.]